MTAPISRQAPDSIDNSVPWAPVRCEVLVVGAGMAGMSAALFAGQRRLSVVQVGIPGEILYASGLFDVLGVYPIEGGRRWRDPWAAVAAVKRRSPDHPYARMSTDDIQKALADVLSFLSDAGLPYRRDTRRNVDLLTPAGTLKRTHAVPQTMWPGVLALRDRRKCLLVDFHGMKGFSARQIQAAQQSRWTGLRTARVAFPEPRASAYPEKMAFALQRPAIRAELARAVAPLVGDARAVGFPAVLGSRRTVSVAADLRSKIGVPVFEVPTLPPAVTGMRLKDAFEQALPALGVRTLYQKRVLRVQVNPDGRFECTVGSDQPELIVQAKAVILATGRFIGQGLAADRTAIRETVFDLPVSQPASRALWHRPDFLDRRGHAINRAGIEIDRHFRPLAADGRPADDRLHAAGSILAHADWIRMKCGSGLAIATAYGAVAAVARHRR